MSAGWAGFRVNPFLYLTRYQLNLWFGDTSDRKGPVTSTGGMGGGVSSQQKNKRYRGRHHPHLSRLRVWATQTLDIKSSCKCCQGTLYLKISGIFFFFKCWDSTESYSNESRDVHCPRWWRGQGYTSGYPWAAHVKSDAHSISIPRGRATLPGAFRKPCGAQGKRTWSQVLVHRSSEKEMLL